MSDLMWRDLHLKLYVRACGPDGSTPFFLFLRMVVALGSVEPRWGLVRLAACATLRRMEEPFHCPLRDHADAPIGVNLTTTCNGVNPNKWGEPLLTGVNPN
jgi:hypothetical protein